MVARGQIKPTATEEQQQQQPPPASKSSVAKFSVTSVEDLEGLDDKKEEEETTFGEESNPQIAPASVLKQLRVSFVNLLNEYLVYRLVTGKTLFFDF